METNWHRRCQPVSIAPCIYITLYIKIKIAKRKNLKPSFCWAHRLGIRIAKSPDACLRQLGHRHGSFCSASREVLIGIAWSWQHARMTEWTSTEEACNDTVLSLHSSYGLPRVFLLSSSVSIGQSALAQGWSRWIKSVLGCVSTLHKQQQHAAAR